jgi:glycosyltransferase involved in cell wall biosynthesis
VSASDSQRVLQVIQVPQHRGAELFALQLSTALRQQTWQSTVMSLFPGDARFVASAAAAGVWGGTLGERRRGPLAWAFLRNLTTQINAAGFPVVQANGAATLQYLATARLVFHSRWRLVYRSIGMPSYWRRDLVRLKGYRWLFRQTDLVVAVCERAGAELVDGLGLPASQVTVIPNGVDARPFLIRSAEARTRVRGAAVVPPEDIVIAHVGSLTAEKNHGAVVRTVAELYRRGLPLRLWIVGDGPEAAAIEHMVRDEGIGAHTWFAGVRSDIAELLAGADLLVLPSLTEGMPAVAIEAALSRLPVVAFNVGGIDEVVQHGKTGLLVAPGDEGALQEAVATLARDPGLRTSMGESARAACLAFEIGRIAARYADAYARVMNANRGAA